MMNVFPLKSINLHQACAMYGGTCTCKERITLVKPNDMLNFYGKNTQTLAKNLNHLDI